MPKKNVVVVVVADAGFDIQPKCIVTLFSINSHVLNVIWSKINVISVEGIITKSNSLHIFSHFFSLPLFWLPIIVSNGDCVCLALEDLRAVENGAFDYFDMIEAIQNRANIFSMQFKFMTPIKLVEIRKYSFITLVSILCVCHVLRPPFPTAFVWMKEIDVHVLLM